MDNKPTPKKWYQKPSIVIALLILFYPIGLIYMWVGKSFSFFTRVLVTILPIFFIKFVMPIFSGGEGDIFRSVFFLISFLKYIIPLVVVYFLLRPLFRDKAKEVELKEQEKQKQIDEFNNKIYSDFQQLGSNKTERTREIKNIFNKKQGAIYCSIHHAFPEWGYIEFSISRSIVAMDAKEREFLQTTMLLYNDELINNQQYRDFLFAFVYGDGKATINHSKYWVNDSLGIKDGSGGVRHYKEMKALSVDSAVSAILSIVDQSNETLHGNKLVGEIKSRIHGGSAWFSLDELDGSVFNGNGSYQLNLGHLEESNTVLHYSGEGSLITIAPPGSGKTQCFVIPNMLNWKGAAVVLDIKGEIYEATHKWREKNIGKVYKFSPLDPSNSNSYNPLAFVRDDPDYIWEDSRFLADMMIVPSGAQDPFWENMARDVLTAAIAYITYKNQPDERPMSKVLDLVYGIGWDEMIASLKTNLSVAAMRQTGYSLSNLDAKQRDSILKTAQSSLSAWQGERISKVTKKADWSPLDLRNGTPTVYICINPNEIESYLSVIRVFIAQHIRMLTTELPQRGSSPVLFMLDELPRLKKMPPVDEALNIGRQYDIKLWMFAQSYGQLKDAYPDPEGLIGSCVVRTFMNLPLNDEFTTKISDQLGHKHDSLTNSKEKLVEPIELAGPNYRDIILVLATNTKPARLRKKFAYQDAELKAKLETI